MLKAELVRFDELTDEEQKLQPNNGWGKEYANYIRIRRNGKTLMILSDAMEPEDATFRRDLRNLVDVIQHVYVMGVKDGKRLSSE